MATLYRVDILGTRVGTTMGTTMGTGGRNSTGGRRKRNQDVYFLKLSSPKRMQAQNACKLPFFSSRLWPQIIRVPWNTGDCVRVKLVLGWRNSISVVNQCWERMSRCKKHAKKQLGSFFCNRIPGCMHGPFSLTICLGIRKVGAAAVVPPMGQCQHKTTQMDHQNPQEHR